MLLVRTSLSKDVRKFSWTPDQFFQTWAKVWKMLILHWWRILLKIHTSESCPTWDFFVRRPIYICGFPVASCLGCTSKVWSLKVLNMISWSQLLQHYYVGNNGGLSLWCVASVSVVMWLRHLHTWRRAHTCVWKAPAADGDEWRRVRHVHWWCFTAAAAASEATHRPTTTYRLKRSAQLQQNCNETSRREWLMLISYQWLRMNLPS